MKAGVSKAWIRSSSFIVIWEFQHVNPRHDQMQVVFNICNVESRCLLGDDYGSAYHLLIRTAAAVKKRLNPVAEVSHDCFVPKSQLDSGAASG